nr:hypothetical protein [Tanacetum cinerariifolium]
LPIGGISDDEFVQLWLSQFAPKKKKRIFATDIAEKLFRSNRVDFMFKVNFLMLFANVMGKADTMRAFVNLSVVRRIREDTNIARLDWCDFIHRCLAISHELNTVSGFYNGPLCFLIITKDSISQCLCCIIRFLILSFFEITQSGESLLIHISLSLSIHNKKWINNIPPLPKYQSWIQENSSNGSFGYNNIFNMSTMPCRRSDLDTMSLDDFYNHLKVYESEVQKKSEPNSQNMAFISSTKHSSGNEDHNTTCVPTASTNVPTASAGVATISQDTACAYITSQSSDGSFCKRMQSSQKQDIGRRDNYKQGSKAKERAPKALMAINGVE